MRIGDRLRHRGEEGGTDRKLRVVDLRRNKTIVGSLIIRYW
jgi:hypothetical protein